jgi:hypothetical protein
MRVFVLAIAGDEDLDLITWVHEATGGMMIPFSGPDILVADTIIEYVEAGEFLGDFAVKGDQTLIFVVPGLEDVHQLRLLTEALPRVMREMEVEYQATVLYRNEEDIHLEALMKYIGAYPVRQLGHAESVRDYLVEFLCLDTGPTEQTG